MAGKEKHGEDITRDGQCLGTEGPRHNTDFETVECNIPIRRG